MKRIFALVVGVFLSVLLIAPMNAFSGSNPGSQQVPKGAKEGQVKETPEAAKSWNEKEKKRSAYKKKALETRQKEMSKTSVSQNQETAK